MRRRQLGGAASGAADRTPVGAQPGAHPSLPPAGAAPAGAASARRRGERDGAVVCGAGEPEGPVLKLAEVHEELPRDLAGVGVGCVGVFGVWVWVWVCEEGGGGAEQRARMLV